MLALIAFPWWVWILLAALIVGVAKILNALARPQQLPNTFVNPVIAYVLGWFGLLCAVVGLTLLVKLVSER